MIKRSFILKVALIIALAIATCLPQAVIGQEPQAVSVAENKKTEYVLYEENFNDVTQRVDLVSGVNYSKTSANGWVYAAKSSGKAYIEQGRMYFAGSGYDVLYRDGGQTWGNYVLEADFCYVTENEGWGGMLYNVQSPTKFQKVSIALDGTAAINGYDSKWTNDSATINKYNMPSGGLRVPNVNEPFRMRVVVENKTATLYYAMVENGVPGEFVRIFSMSNMPANAQTGSIGFMTSNGKLGSYWVDNIKCYSATTVSFTEDFESYGSVTLTPNALHAASGINYVKNFSTGTGKIEGGKLILNGGGSSYDAAFFTMSKNWTNYTVEADLTYYSTPTGWMGVLYRSTDLKNFQKAVVSDTKRGNLNGKLNGAWYKNNEGVALIDYDGKIVIGKEFRIKVVAEENSAKLYLAHYDESGNLGDWTYVMGHENNFADIHMSGMIGFIVGGGTNTRTCHASIDNVVVHRGSDRMTEAPVPANVADIYEPNSGLVNPPVAVQNLGDSLPSKTGRRPAILLAEVDENMNLIGSTGKNHGSVESFIDGYRDSLIPAFIVDSESEATALSSVIERKNLIDCYVVADSEQANLVKKVRLSNSVTKLTSGALIFDDLNTVAARKAARALVADNMSYVAISRTLLSEESSKYFNVRQVAAWSTVSDKAGVYSGIASGWHGMVCSDANIIYDVYESITEPTVSGKPIVIAHRGANIAVGYPENTLMGYKAAVEQFGADAIEIDVRITSDGYLYLMHDGTVDRTTNGTGNGGSFTLSELKNLVVDEVSGKRATVPTFEELLQYLRGTDIVAYCHINIQNDKTIVSFMHLLEKYDCKDNVVFFISNDSRSNYNSNTTRTATNTVYGLTNAPVVRSGVVYTAGDTDVLQGKGSVLYGVEALKNNLNAYNYQPLYYKYSNRGATFGTESFYYQSAARGFVNSHSITNGQAVMDETALIKSGAVGFLTDNINLCDDYHYTVEAQNEELMVGESITLKRNLVMTVGKTEVECKLVQLSGEPLVKTADGYTSSSAGEVTLVYYATRKTEGGSTYAVYSQPVTVNFVGHSYVKVDEVEPTCTENGMKEHYACNNCDKLFELVGGEYVEIARESLIIEKRHSLVTVEALNPTCTEDGYTEHKACEKCDYTEGKEIISAEHKYTLVNKTEPTCTENGMKEHYACSSCDKLFELIGGEYVEVTIDSLTLQAAHSLSKVNEKPATTESEGVKEHFVCSVCDKLFVENNGAYVEVTLSQLKIDKLPEENKGGCAGSAMELFALLSVALEFAFIVLKGF